MRHDKPYGDVPCTSVTCIGAISGTTITGTGAVSGTSITGSGELIGPKMKFTVEGGLAVLMTNKTGHTSIKGEVVTCDDSANNAVKLVGASGINPIGAIYNAGVATDAEVWVVVSGRAQVALKDETAATRDLWIGTCSTAGRVQCVADPTITSIHSQECGHCCETVSAGGPGVLTLCYTILQFN